MPYTAAVMSRAVLTLLSLLLASTPIVANDGPCPHADEVLDVLRQRHVERTARTARFDRDVPWDLFRKAAKKPGKPVADRDDDQSMGVMVLPLPIEQVWMALNDEDHHAGVLPVVQSVVVDGEPRGIHRGLFQSFDKWNVGRWWVSDITLNEALYRKSGGTLWELTWVDRMADTDPTMPPMSELDSGIKPIVSSRGAWLMSPLGPQCTFVETFNWSDPGGFLGATQWILASRSVRDTLRGLQSLAEEHVLEPHGPPPFVRPDGSPIE